MFAQFQDFSFYDAARDTYVFKSYRYWWNQRDLCTHEEIGNFRELFLCWKDVLIYWFPEREIAADVEKATERDLYSAARWALNGNGGKLNVIKSF